MQVAMLALYKAAEQAYIERDRMKAGDVHWNRWNDAAAYAVARADQIGRWGQRFPKKGK